MATLTKSTGTVTLSGAAEKVTLPASYGWVWVKNMSDSDIFAGLSADISEGADGVMAIPAGECGRVQMDGSREFYLLGTGNALVVAQNYADCPFKAGGKGGESPDLSEYAKKTDIPTKLPADGGNADTATTLSDWAGTSLTNANDAPLGISRIHGENFSDGGNAPFDFWTTILTLGPNDRNDYRQQFAFPWSKQEAAFFPKYRVLDNGTWGEWIEAGVKTMTYTIAFSEITWVTTGSGKYAYDIPSLNVNKILSVTLSEPWGTISADEIIQPYIRNSTQASIMSNVKKTTGSMSVCIVYN